MESGARTSVPSTPHSGQLPTPDQVRNLLRAVIDPELGDNVVDLGMVGDITVAPDGVVRIGFKLTIKGCPLRAHAAPTCWCWTWGCPTVTGWS